MAWFDVLCTGAGPEIRPTCPTSKIEVGQQQNIMAVAPSHPSHLFHQKNDLGKLVPDLEAVAPSKQERSKEAPSEGEPMKTGLAVLVKAHGNGEAA